MSRFSYLDGVDLLHYLSVIHFIFHTGAGVGVGVDVDQEPGVKAGVGVGTALPRLHTPTTDLAYLHRHANQQVGK